MNTRPLEIRFWERVKKSDGCWEWTGGKFDNGYGAIGYQRRTQRAHRISYLLHNGKIPAGMVICHKCDNPGCVRPDHLFLGTLKDNSQDMLSKNRRRHCAGVLNGQAKLTEAQVLEIRERYSRGGITKRELAKDYPMTTMKNIEQIVLRSTWRHLP